MVYACNVRCVFNVTGCGSLIFVGSSLFSLHATIAMLIASKRHKTSTIEISLVDYFIVFLLQNIVVETAFQIKYCRYKQKALQRAQPIFAYILKIGPTLLTTTTNQTRQDCKLMTLRHTLHMRTTSKTAMAVVRDSNPISYYLLGLHLIFSLKLMQFAY